MPISGIYDKNAGPAPEGVVSPRDPIDSISDTMAQLAASIISHDEEFKRQLAAMLRAAEFRSASSRNGAAATARQPGHGRRRHQARCIVRNGGNRAYACRASVVAMFAIAAGRRTRLILQAMRAGANEFFPWHPGGATRRPGRWRSRSMAPFAGPRPARRPRTPARPAVRDPGVPRREGRRRHDDRRGQLRGGAGALSQRARRSFWT